MAPPAIPGWNDEGRLRAVNDMDKTTMPAGVEPIAKPPYSNRLKMDENGHMIPRTDEEQDENAVRLRKLVEILRATPADDPPGETEAFMRAMDSHRPHRPLFEGYY